MADYFKFVLTAATVFILMSAVAAWAGASPEKVQQGEKIYAERKCSACHMIHGKGGKVGPDLSVIGDRRDEEWLEKFLSNPKSVFPETIMPSFRGSHGELEVLAEYLESLKKEVDSPK